MTEHLTDQQLNQYATGEGAPADLLRFDDHVGACEACRAIAAKLASATDRSSAFAREYRAVTSIESDHLDFEQLAAIVDGAPDTDLIVAAHVGVCADCARELQELRVVKQALASPQAIATPPVPLTPRKSAIITTLRPHHLPAKPKVVVASTGWPQPLKIAAGVLIALGAVSALLWSMRSSPGGPTIAQATPPASASPQTSPSQAPALVALTDATGTISLNQDKSVSGLTGLSPATTDKIREALERGTVVNPAAFSGLGSHRDILLSGGDPVPDVGSFSVSYPVARITESDRPTFRWKELPDAADYIVRVVDENFQPVTESPLQSGTEWRSDVPLKRGRDYFWQVTAHRNGEDVRSPRPPAPQARFRVLDAATASELRGLRQIKPQSHLALGVVLARAGLLEEAERELNQLLASNQESDVLRKLIAEVQTARRKR